MAGSFDTSDSLSGGRTAVERTILGREFVTVDTSYGTIRVKLGRHRGAVTSCVPEFEDCRAAADRAGAAVALVIETATAAARRLV